MIFEICFLSRNLYGCSLDKLFVFLAGVFFCILPSARAQQISEKIYPRANFWVLSEEIFAPSFQIKEFHPAADNFSFEIRRDTVFFLSNKKPIFCDSLVFTAKRKPELLREKYFRSQKEYDKTKSEYNLGGDMYDSLPVFDRRRGITAVEKEEVFETKGLTKTGSISRGVSAGNTQDVFVNSNLNLQLEGNLSEDLKIKAVISDQNVPFQPEGNTQNLQEFDKVIISLEHKHWHLQAGNVLIKNAETYFSRYTKNVIGGMLQVNYAPFSRDSLRAKNFAAQSTFAASMARGQFQNMVLSIFEGVQGPYRLTGANNERFIMVLAGSERVFLDGVLLKRGFQYDYVIDYNTAEITFMSSVVITRFSRVRIEFEYAVQYYNRSILNFRHKQNAGKWTFLGDFYREKDNPYAPLTFSLDSVAQRVLRESGDSLSKATASRVQMVEEFNVNRILYTYKDTVEADGTPVRIYVRANRDTPPYLQVGFTEVAQGTGDYKQGDPKANGREYFWVGKNKGNFTPLAQIPAANGKQILTFAIQYKPTKNEKFFVETALSNNDLNLLSPIHNEDNRGTAFRAGFLSENRSFAEKIAGKNTLRIGADYEFNAKNFRPIDRFRPIEFDRDWSYNPATGFFEEHIFRTAFSFEKKRKTRDSTDLKRFFLRQGDVFDLKSNLTFRRQVGNLSGRQEIYAFRKGFSFFIFDTEFFRLNAENRLHVSFWERLATSLTAYTRIVETGLRFSTDKNRVTLKEKDSVSSSAMYFEEMKFFVQKNDSLRGFRYSADFTKRRDYSPQAGVIAPFTDTRMWRGEWSLNKKTQLFRMNGTYRELKSLVSNFSDEATVMGRLDWRGKWFGNVVQHEFIAQIGSGREQRRDFVYVPVDIGQGTHVWRDDNGDGVQQINEFYEAVLPDEKIYVKFWIPSNDFVNAYTKDFTMRMTGGFPAAWAKSAGVKKFFSRFSNTFSLNSQQKNTSQDPKNRFLPFTSVREESALISEKEIWRSNVFFNKSNRIFALEWAFQKNSQKNLLAGGYERRLMRENRANLRLTVKKIYTLRLTWLFANKESGSDFMSNRNFSFTHHSFAPEIALQSSTKFRYSVFADLAGKRSPQGERADLTSFGAEMRALQNDRIFQVKIKQTKIRYNAEINTPLAYDMLDALQTGSNWLWEASVQQKIFNGLRLNLNYNGRKSGSLPFIHTGRVQLTALF
jgi:hypothetical protein